MPKWLEDAVFYEIYPQSFFDTNGDGIGDINGVTAKLDYIQELGCNAIWLNPCFDSPFKDAGYDVRDYKKVAKRYGSNEDLARCFAEAHKRKMHVILDLVPGHTSIQHPWFHQSQKAKGNEYSNRYIWTDSVWNRPAGLNYLCGVSERSGCCVLNFFSTQPALNYGFRKITAPWQLRYTDAACIATRTAMKDVMRFWLAKGCDGFRVDMAGSLVKNDFEGEATAEVWRDILGAVRKEYPEMVAISEWSDPEKAINKALFDMDFYLNQEGNGYHSLFRKTGGDGSQRSFFSSCGNGNIMDFLDEYLVRYNATKDHGYISLITCNHDTPRLTKAFDTQELKLSYAFLLTMPGVPFIYYGDEIGMQYANLPSKEGGYERTGTRTPMQWSFAASNRGFSNAEPKNIYLPVDKRDCAPCVDLQIKDKDSLLNFVRELLKMRHDNSDIGTKPNLEIVFAKANTYPFVYKRGKFILAVNPSKERNVIPLMYQARPFYSLGECSLVDNQLQMEGQSFGIFEI